jgi:hypothetical protein
VSTLTDILHKLADGAGLSSLHEEIDALDDNSSKDTRKGSTSAKE